MKPNKKISIVILFVALTLAAIASPAYAEAERTSFTGVETLLGPVDPNPGVGVCVGGMCRGTGFVWQAIEATTDPRASGQMTIVVNSIGHLNNGVSPMWGTFRIANDLGEWNGTWSGSHRLVDGNDIVNIQGTARGSGGLAGLVSQWRWTGLNVSQDNPYHQISGTIIETGQ